MITLFDPSKYGATEWDGLSLAPFNSGHREFGIAINRDGISSATINLYFNGSSNHFEEIPDVLTMNYLNEIKRIESDRI